MQFYEKRVLVQIIHFQILMKKQKGRGEGGTEMAGSRKGVK